MLYSKQYMFLEKCVNDFIIVECKVLTSMMLKHLYISNWFLTLRTKAVGILEDGRLK